MRMPAINQVTFELIDFVHACTTNQELAMCIVQPGLMVLQSIAVTSHCIHGACCCVDAGYCDQMCLTCNVPQIAMSVKQCCLFMTSSSLQHFGSMHCCHSEYRRLEHNSRATQWLWAPHFRLTYLGPLQRKLPAPSSAVQQPRH